MSFVCALILVFYACKRESLSETKSDETSQIRTRSGDTGWDYPVKPGMGEWNSLVTENERIAVLQVPEAVLATLSPDDVVRLCITFPAFGHFGAWNTPQDGFNILLKRYNILRHLLTRENVGEGLIAAYKDAGMTGFRTLPYSNLAWSVKLFYLELLLSQKEILQKMTPDEKLELITEARSKLFEKANNEAFASSPGILFTVRIMATILDIERYPEFMGLADRETAISFIETGWYFGGVPSIDEIIRITENYINAKNLQE